MASRRLYAMRVLKPSFSKDEMILVYNSLVRSLFEYCAPLFMGSSACNKSKFDRLQKRFHRIICGKSCKEPCLSSLSERREILSLKFLMKIMQPNHVLHHLLPFQFNSGRFRLLSRRTTRRSLSFFPLVCEMYNNSLAGRKKFS